MKKIIFYFSILLLVVSCANDPEHVTKEIVSSVNEVVTEEVESAKISVMDPRSFGGEKSESQLFIDEISADVSAREELGFWVGNFGDNMINIHLYEINNGVANGYSVCAGNFRPITGTFTNDKKAELVFVMSEPGDDKYDGKFEFTINTEGMTLKGKWIQFSDGKEKNYELKQREFLYDQAVGEYPEASQRELTYVDVEDKTELELGIMRNEIYARHGYSFKNKDYRRYFEDTEWYMPLAVDVREKLSDIEVKNIELIYEYESYFEEYYDDYGR